MSPPRKEGSKRAGLLFVCAVVFCVTVAGGLNAIEMLGCAPGPQAA